MNTNSTHFQRISYKSTIMILVLFVTALFNLCLARAETADSIFAYLEQSLTITPADTFKTTANKGYLYNRKIVSKEVEVRVFFNPNPNFSDQNNAFFFVMKDFKGPGTYTLEDYPGNSALYSSWYGNNDMCTIGGTVIVEEYDSTANYIKASFNVRVTSGWKTSSGQGAKGTFRFGFTNKLIVQPGNKIDLEIGKTVNLDITLLSSNLPIAGANIYITDTIQSAGPEKLFGTTDASGKIKYLVKSDKVIKEKVSTILVRAEKDGKEIARSNIAVNLKFPSACFSVTHNNTEVFNICGVGIDHWDKTEGEPTLTSNSGIVINNFLYFTGTVVIDTVALGIKAVGEYHIKNIPLPGGKIGSFSFGKGTYDFKLLGESGLLTLVSCVGKEKGCTLFEGYEIDVTDIKLLGGRNAHGVEVSATIKINGLTSTCSLIGGDKSEFAIDGLAISSVEGISVKGFKTKSLGLYYPGFCMRDFSFNYDKKEDVLSIGAKVKIPICEIGGGFQISKGSLDSIGWSLEVSYPPLVVFAPTTIGMSGFYGKIEGFAKNSEKKFGVKLGGILCDAVVPIAYSFKLYGEYKQPSFFEFGAEDISFFKTGDFWQVVGAGSGSVDFQLYLIKLKAELKAGTGDGDTYYFKGAGQVSYSKKTEQGGLAGQLSGELTIPARSETKVERWMSKKMGLPYTATAYARFSYKSGKTISGEIDFGKEYGNVLYSMNFDKNFYDPDFLFLNIPKLNEWGIGGIIKLNPLDNMKEIAIPDNAKFALLIRNDVETMLSSVLVDPSGKEYKFDVVDKNITYLINGDKTEEYWTLIKPEAGVWKLKYTPTTQLDSLDIYVMPGNNKVDFAINASQTAKAINVTWDKSNLFATDSVDIYLDSDTSNYDGAYYATFPANTGSASIVLDETLLLCKFYVSANLIRRGIAYPSYAAQMLNNPRSKFAPPIGIASSYNELTERLSLNWAPSADPSVIGYTIRISDGKNLDSILTTVYKEQTSAEFYIKAAAGKQIEMLSFTENGESGCAGKASIISVVAGDPVVTHNEPIYVYPNPANDILKISYNPIFGSIDNIQIVSLLGENMASVGLSNYSNTPELKEIDLSNFSSGVYYLKYSINQTNYAITFTIIK